EFLPLYDTFGLGTTVWSALASGILTGKYSQGIAKDSRMTLPGYEWLRARMDTPEGRDKIQKTQKLAPIAQELGASMAQLALAWCLANPRVSTVILGASKKSQLQENLKALEIFPKLTPQVLERIEQIVQNKPKPPEDFT